MKLLIVKTLNNTYELIKDKDGLTTIITSTHPDKELMKNFFIGKRVTNVEIGLPMLTRFGNTSKVVSIEDKGEIQ
jgi:hypothetical protein